MKKFIFTSIVDLISKRFDNRIKSLITGTFAFLTILMTSEAHAIPVWSFTPLTSTTITMPFDGTANIRYLVTNNSRRPHVLAMQLIPGISQDTSPGNCPNPFFLAGKASCVLNLTATASGFNSTLVGGPVVCDGFSRLECYQPSPENSLNISKGFAVSFEVTGLSERLTLLNNGTDRLVTDTDGFFTFNTLLPDGSPYSVTVESVQPEGALFTPIERCTVVNGSGIVRGGNIGNIEVVCAPNAYTVGGTITGLSGSVTLSNLGQTIVINANGNFTFPTPIADGTPYDVVVQSQTGTQTCSVSNGEGIVNGANVNDVVVTCATNAFTVGGQISNLSGTVILSLSEESDLVVSNNGSFTFPKAIAQNSPYEVTVKTHPVGQTCSVANASGIMGGANVTNVAVNCLANTTTLSVNQQIMTIPVGGSTATITVNNTGTNPAINVRAVLRPGWVAVTQDATNCSIINPGSSCNLVFSSPEGYVAAPVRVNKDDSPYITGDNIDNPPKIAIGFTIASASSNYLIWDVASTGSSMTYQVIDDGNVAEGQPWSTPIVLTNATNRADGRQNTNTIVSLGLSQSAAANCYNSGNGGASTGTWYLPAICQMGGTRQGALCGQNGEVLVANFNSNLIVPGFGKFLGLVPVNQPTPPGPSDFFNFWSSTETSASNAWGEAFGNNGTSPQLNFTKTIPINVRCAREFTL